MFKGFKQRDLVSVLQHHAIVHPGKRAFAFLEEGEQETTSITYGELDKKSRIIGAYLQAKQLAGQRVALLYPSGIDFITAFMGCLYAGVIAVPVSMPTAGFKNARAEAGMIIKDADIDGILTLHDVIDSAVALASEHLGSKTIFAMDASELDPSLSAAYKTPDISGKTIAFLQYTSGATSPSKGAVIQHENLLHSLKTLIKAWDYTKSSVSLNWAPHTHIYGLIVGILAPLYHGSISILMPTHAFITKPLCWLNAISKYQVTHSGGPNFAYNLCLDEIQETELSHLNLSHWKVAVNGGEQVHYETLIRFNEKFSVYGFHLSSFRPTYGMSELTGGVSTYTHHKKPRIFNLSQSGLAHNRIILAKEGELYSRFIGSGYPMQGLDIAIVDPDTNLRVHKGLIGEVWVNGKSVAKGYWNRLEETQDKFYGKISKSKKNYFKTGDLGFLYRDELCLTGRLKDLIVLYGKKYYPLELEATVNKVLEGFPVNSNGIVFSFSVDEKEQVIFVQELREENPTLHNEIIKIIRETITSNYGIELYDIVLVKENSIPKTTSGKLQRRLCQQQFLNHEIPVVARYTEIEKDSEQLPLSEVSVYEESTEKESPIRFLNKYFFQDFINILASTLQIDIQAINLNALLSEYHIDSVKTIQLVTTLNERYGFNISPAILFEYATFADFYNDLLEKHESLLLEYYHVNSEKFVEPSTPMPVIPFELSETQSVIPHSSSNDIAIIGMSGVFPDADSLEIFWNHLMTGKNVIREIPKNRWDWETVDEAIVDKDKIKWGGFVDKISAFDANFFHISPREAELMDPQQRIFLQVVWKTIEDAGYSPEALSKQNPGLFVGVFGNDYAQLIENSGIEDAYLSTGITHSILANRISYLLNFHGPSVAIDTACSSSLVAVHQAVQAIHNGDCAVAIAGGVNALLSPANYIAGGAAGMLSEDGFCKTFDKDANGYVRGEGCAAILLKPLSEAVADRDHIYGVIKGTAVNHGGHINSLTAPNPQAQANVIIAACERAHVPIETINYVETHGTGTSLGDPIEINGLKIAFSHLAETQGHKILPDYYCALGAVKTHIGHLESAAGIAGVVKVLLSMQHKTLPSNLHFTELNPYIQIIESPFYILDKNQYWPSLKDENSQDIPRRAGVSSFGYGGTNAHIILEELLDNKSCTDIAGSQNGHDESISTSAFLIPISAQTRTALEQRIHDLKNFLIQTKKKPSLSAISYILGEGRKHFKYRCAWIVESIDELRMMLETIWNDPDFNHFLNHLDQSTIAIDASVSNENIDYIFEEANAIKHSSPLAYRSKLSEIANFYIKGCEIQWRKLWEGETVQRISLPTYPFDETHYWIPKKSIEETPVVDVNPVEIPLEPYAMEINPALLSEIQQHFKEQLSVLLKIEPHTIGLTIPLSELGLDSITLREFAVALKNYYAININPALFFTYTTIEMLSQYLINTYPEAIAKAHQRGENAAVAEDLSMPEMEVVEPEHMQIQQRTMDINVAHQTSSVEPIAIIGMHGIFPQSKNLNELWNHLEAGDDLICEVPSERWDWHHYYGDAKKQMDKTEAKWGGFLKDIDQFDAAFFNISPHEANLMDPQQRLFLETVWNAIEDAGYDPFALANGDVGVFAGVEFHEYASMIAEQQLFHGLVATGNSPAILANRVSYCLNFTGPSEVIETACSSALVAVHHAINALHQGECAVAIAGAVSLNLDPKTVLMTSQLGILSVDGRCKTFDQTANGYVKGEGVGAVVLKPLSQAQKEGDYIYALIKGSAVKHGGKAQSLTAPNAIAQRDLLIKAYTKAGISPDTIGYIETHGTGTELGDPVEVEGLKQAFQSLSSNESTTPKHVCGLGSIKTSIGHLEPASGIAGLMKVVLAMQHEKIPANLHFKNLNPYIEIKDSPFYIVDQLKPWTRLKDVDGNTIPLRAGVSSFGFGGTIAHAVIEEAPALSSSRENLKPYYLVTLSAKEERSLTTKIQDLSQWLLLQGSNSDLSSLSFTLNAGRTHFSVRCAMVVHSIENLIATLQSLHSGKKLENCFKRSVSDEDDTGPLFSELYESTIHLIHSTSLSPEVYRKKLLLLADLYTKNFLIDWNLLYAPGSQRRLASLPYYPFIKQRYWFNEELSTEPKQSHFLAENTENYEHFTADYLRKIFSGVIKLAPESIAMDVTYENYGIDSILTLEIINRLENDFGTLPKTLLYEKNQLRQLVEYFEENFQETLKTLRPKNIGHSSEIIAPLIQQKNITRSVKPLKKAYPQNDIAIIGLSGIYPMAEDVNVFWKNLVEGKNCISEIPKERWNYLDYPILVNDVKKYYPHGGFIPDVDKFDPQFFNIAPYDAALMDPQERLFLQTAWATFEDAGYTRERLQNVQNDVGVFVGVTYHFYPLFLAEEWHRGHQLPLDIQMFSIANRVSYFMNLHGPSYVIDTACSSSLAAIHLACESILTNQCTMALAGGVNLSLHPCKYHFLGTYGFLSEQGQCASFAAGGSGYVPSEGVGAVLLKPLSLALEAGDPIYGVIKGSSMNHGGKTSGYTVPNPNAHAELIQDALARANVDPHTISYVEAHGTGTSLGDPIEVKGLQSAFEQYTSEKQFCAIGSVKSNIGHLESAAGISQLTKVLLQMQHQKLVPSLHAENLNPYIHFENTPFFVQKTLNDWRANPNHPRRAGISSFGAGGTNVHMIVEEFMTDSGALAVSEQQPGIFLLSALNSERLMEYAKKMYQFLLSHEDNHSNTWMMDLCYTSQVGRENMPTRLAVLVTSYDTWLQSLKSYIEHLEETKTFWVNHLTEPTHTSPLTSQEVLGFVQKSDYEALIQLWIHGKKIPWESLYAEKKPKRVSMPTYPFEKRRCWVSEQYLPAKTSPIDELNSAVSSNTMRENKDDRIQISDSAREWLYKLFWEKKTAEVSMLNKSMDHWLIFSDEKTGFELQKTLKNDTHIYCFPGPKFLQMDIHIFYVNPSSPRDYQRLIATVFEKENNHLDGIIYHTSFAHEESIENFSDLWLASDQLDISDKMLYLLQALLKYHWEHALPFLWITKGGQQVSEQDSVQPWEHAPSALMQIFAAEQTKYQILQVDLDKNSALEEDVKLILNEMQIAQPEEDHVAYREGQRYVARLKPLLKDTDSLCVHWHVPETALITGGLGALGAEIAEWLLREGTQYLLLIGTTSLPPREEWATIENPSLKKKIETFMRLEQYGVTVEYRAIDVSNKEKMQLAIHAVEECWKKPIQSVFHLAGMTTDNLPIEKMPQEILYEILLPKVKGALALHEIFKDVDLKHFVLFSSIAAFPYFGMRGLSAYATANAFLNGLAEWRRCHGLPAMSINWESWASKGMGFEYNHNDFLEAMGMSPLVTEQGLEILKYLLTTSWSQVGVFKVQWGKFLSMNPDARKSPFFAYFTTELFNESVQPVSILNREQIYQHIIETFAESLGLSVSEIDPTIQLHSYGLDSIIGIQFVSKLSVCFPGLISPMDLYRYTTINQMTDYLQKKMSFASSSEMSSAQEVLGLIERELEEI